MILHTYYVHKISNPFYSLERRELPDQADLLRYWFSENSSEKRGAVGWLLRELGLLGRGESVREVRYHSPSHPEGEAFIAFPRSGVNHSLVLRIAGGSRD